MKAVLVFLLITLLRSTHQGIVFTDFTEHFTNFLVWKAQKNEPIGKGKDKLSNFIKFIDEVGRHPEKIRSANLTYRAPKPWVLSN